MLIAKRRTIYLLLLFLSLWVSAIYLAYESYSTLGQTRQIIESDLKVITARNRAKTAHLVMNMAPQMAAYTLDRVRYKTLYDRHDVLDSTLKVLAKRSSTDLIRQIKKNIMPAVRQVQRTEVEAFEMIEQNETDKALNLLNSSTYLENKELIDDFFHALDEEVDAIAERVVLREDHLSNREGIYLFICLLIVGLSVLIGVNFLYARKEIIDSVKGKLGRDEGRFAVMSRFANELGAGNYSVELELANADNDELADALIAMRNKLKSVAEEDTKRNWVNEGYNKISDILRGKDDLKELADEVLSFLMSYLNANQGGLYAVVEPDDDSKDAYIELISFYAFEKKKFIDQRFDIGQGLVGQTVKEGKLTYLTEVPENYVQITSGMGQAKPRVVAIVPLIFNQKTEGVLEIASFHVLEEHQIKFLTDIGEIVASSLSAMKVSQKTKRLLEESQEMTSNMKQQEEEMRQNMEELMATQEEAERRERETAEELASIRALLRETEEKKTFFKAMLKQHGVDLKE